MLFVYIPARCRVVVRSTPAYSSLNWWKYAVYESKDGRLRWSIDYDQGRWWSTPPPGSLTCHDGPDGRAGSLDGTEVTQNQAEKITGLVGPPAYDRLRELVHEAGGVT
jgi:hypothetical protein